MDIHQRYPKLNLVSVAVEGSMDDLPKLKKLTKELNMGTGRTSANSTATPPAWPAASTSLPKYGGFGLKNNAGFIFNNEGSSGEGRSRGCDDDWDDEDW